MSGYSRVGPVYDPMIHAWARACGLRESTRTACIHTSTKRVPHHFCQRDSSLTDHATLWIKNGVPVVLLAHIYAPDIETLWDEWRHEVEQYASGFGCIAWVGKPDAPVSFWNRGYCSPVIYCPQGHDPYECIHWSMARSES